MTVTVPPELAEWVDEQVRVGRYASPDEAVADGLQRLAEPDDFRAAVEAGLAQADRGEVKSLTAAATLARIRAGRRANP